MKFVFRKIFLILSWQLLIILPRGYGERCKYGQALIGKATYHRYSRRMSMNHVACQLPMSFNRQHGRLRVTAVNRVHALSGNLMCGDCIEVQNINGGKSTVVKVIDFCANGDLDLCPQAFAAIDTSDRSGYIRGQMRVRWQKASCEELIDDGRIKYRYKSGTDRWNRYMGVTIMDPLVPLARTRAVQISNENQDPNSWFDCRDNGAEGYWFCSGHKKRKEDPFYLKIKSIDGQVLVDKIDHVVGFDEGEFVPTTKQFKSCERVEKNSSLISFSTEIPPNTPSITTPSTTTTPSATSTQDICIQNNCGNCLWDYKIGVACYSNWTKWQCTLLKIHSLGYHWCGK